MNSAVPRSHLSDNHRPNIILILPDQQRPDSLGCFGAAAAQTPNIDALANSGVVFDNCYVQNPLCCPSRYSLLTGRYPHSHRVRSNWYAPREGEQSFAHAVGRAGYSSAAVGKMHFTPWNDNFGFDGRIIAEAKFHTQCPDDYERFLALHGKSRKDMYDFADPVYKHNLTAEKSRFPQELHIDSFVGRSSCEYLKNVSGPFCLFTSFLSPHNPYDPPSPYDELFDPSDFPARNMGPDEIALKPREAYDYINNRLRMPFKTDEITEEQRRLMWKYYSATCTLIDDWVGEMVGILKKRGLYDNTIIMYSSDHGDLLGDHGLFYKQAFYEQSVRVPLIVHAPERFKARRSDSLIEQIDLYSTICSLAGAQESPGSQGKSLLPLLEGRDDHVHREAAFSENYFGRMIRYEEWKMVYYTGKPYGEMYNLNDDPLEQNNLWDSMKNSRIMRDMKDLLLEWCLTSEDPLSLPVRADHFDDAPRQYEMHHGGTREARIQPWYLPNMLDLYDGWDFSVPGTLR